ncbi:hypothetical protein [Streptomyces sp. NPDC101132]|uniref:hypothetical protein n=1 Tax=Streptomyces sp. NPDC101132 TaxID=3366110 RepID=UPI00381E5F22
MRKLTAAVGTVLAVTATTLAVAPQAQAAEVHLQSHAWTTQENGRIHAVFNVLDDDVHPSDVSLRVRRKGADQVLTTLKLNGTESCPETGCWDSTFLSEPAKLPGLGVYTVDVVVDEGQADERVDRDNSELDYGLDPQLTVAGDHPTDSWEHPVTVTGTLRAEDPDTHEIKPFPGASVSKDVPHGGTWERTDADGRFTDVPEFREATEVALTYSFHSARASLTVKRDRKDLKLAVDAPGGTITAPSGSTIPVRGRVTGTTDSGVDKPVSDMYMFADGRYTSSWTKADGSFSFTYGVGRNTSVTVMPGGTYHFNPAPRQVVKLRLVPTRFEALKATVSKYRKVTFSGTLGVTEGSYPAGTTTVVDMQHSPDGRTWSTVGSFTARYGEAFAKSPSRTAPAGSSHWRLRIAAAAQSSASFRLGRKATLLVNDDVTPEPVRKGATLTAKGGLLQEYGSSWKSFAGQTVRVWFKASGSTAWKQLGTATTGNDGTFSRKFTAQRDGTWQVRYTDTPSTHYADLGREDFVDVR